MSSFDKNRRSSQFLTAEAEAFIVDRQSRNFTPTYLNWYADEYASKDWNSLAKTNSPIPQQRLAHSLTISKEEQAYSGDCLLREPIGTSRAYAKHAHYHEDEKDEVACAMDNHRRPCVLRALRNVRREQPCGQQADVNPT
jgi:hypothetical protein